MSIAERRERGAGEGGASAPADPTREARGLRPWWRILAGRGALLLVGLLLMGFALSRGLAAVGGPSVIRERFGWLAPVVSALIHAPLAASPFPSEIFALSHGPLYGFWGGAVVGWIGWWLGSLIEYWVLKRWRVEAGRAPLRIARPRWLARFPVGHPVFLIFARQLPYGYHLVNVAAAVGGVGLARHCWCSLISQIPTALFISAVGVGMIRLD